MLLLPCFPFTSVKIEMIWTEIYDIQCWSARDENKPVQTFEMHTYDILAL